MEPLSSFQMTVILLLATLVVNSVNLVHGQVSSSCTTSLMSSFTPCGNIITGSTNNGLVPSTTCCDSLRSLMSTNMDCACQVMSANAPLFQQSINQVLALSLSQACNINGFNIQCNKASSTPLPAAGPAVVESDSPTLPPVAAAPLSPQVSKTVVVADAYKYESMQLAQAQAPAAASSPMEAEAPTETPGIRPVLTPLPSASHPSYVSFSPSAFILIGIMVFAKQRVTKAEQHAQQLENQFQTVIADFQQCMAALERQSGGASCSVSQNRRTPRHPHYNDDLDDQSLDDASPDAHRF